MLKVALICRKNYKKDNAYLVTCFNLQTRCVNVNNRVNEVVINASETQGNEGRLTISAEKKKKRFLLEILKNEGDCREKDFILIVSLMLKYSKKSFTKI